MRRNGGIGEKLGGLRRFLRAPVISAACVLGCAVIAPTVVKAFTTGSESTAVSLAARGAVGSFTPSSLDNRLVAQVSLRAIAHGKLFRFTPASSDNRPTRAVTVAVRLPDSHNPSYASQLFSNRLLSGQTFAARGSVETGAGLAAANGLANVRITPLAFNLGTARGYQSFALPAPGPLHDLARDGSELRTFSLTTSAPVTFAKDSAPANAPRLAANVAFDERDVPGVAPRTIATQGDYQVKMGGSYRLVGNLDVTAGLRLSTDRDRLRPLTDHRQDSQAIYVGTQFRF